MVFIKNALIQVVSLPVYKLSYSYVMLLSYLWRNKLSVSECKLHSLGSRKRDTPDNRKNHTCTHKYTQTHTVRESQMNDSLIQKAHKQNEMMTICQLLVNKQTVYMPIVLLSIQLLMGRVGFIAKLHCLTECPWKSYSISVVSICLIGRYLQIKLYNLQVSLDIVPSYN